MTKQYSTVQAAVDAIRAGKVVIVVDDEDRENEGDFICAAQNVTSETINFMLRGRGQLCALPYCQRPRNDWSCDRSFKRIQRRCKRLS